MTFIWVMRDKGSEWRTLRRFLASGRLPFSPLIEAVCEPYFAREDSSPKSPVAVLRTFGEKLGPLTDSGRVWVDLGHLLRLFSAADVGRFHKVVRQNIGLATHLATPIIRSSSPPEVVDAVFRWAHQEGAGIGVRIEGAQHLRDKAAFAREILKSSGLPGSEIDLFFDAQDLPRAASYEQFQDLFPLTLTARTWAVLGGAFPASITEMSPETFEHFLDRDEWDAWKEEIGGKGLRRIPLYGDYATQPALYSPSPSFPGSPSLRYTAERRFVLLRGRGGVRGQGIDYRQYIGHAIHLIKQPYFREVCPTPADEYVQLIASRTHGTGNMTTWRVASLQRHLTLVATQVAQVAATIASSSVRRRSR